MSVRQDVDRGLEIIAKMAELKTEMKEIETRLQLAGRQAGSRGEHEALKDAERDGKQWLAKLFGGLKPGIKPELVAAATKKATPEAKLSSMEVSK